MARLTGKPRQMIVCYRCCDSSVQRKLCSLGMNRRDKCQSPTDIVHLADEEDGIELTDTFSGISTVQSSLKTLVSFTRVRCRDGYRLASSF